MLIQKFFKIVITNSYITNLELFQEIHFHLLCVKNLMGIFGFIGSRGVWCFWCFDGDDSRNVSCIDSESFIATCRIYICSYYNSLDRFYAAVARTSFKGDGQQSLHHFWYVLWSLYVLLKLCLICLRWLKCWGKYYVTYTC